MPKKKIAILGGGIGAMAAAFELTSEPDWNNRYEVTVYQIGWRLGGKCATGRNLAVKSRIEEHGIHFLLGFYENAFRLVRNLYDEYLPHFHSPFTSWQDAFRQQDTTTAMYQEGDRWLPYGVAWPRRPGLPGDFSETEDQPSAWSYIRTITDWMVSILKGLNLKIASYLTNAVAPAGSQLRRIVPGLPHELTLGESAANAFVSYVEQQMLAPVEKAFNTASQYPDPPATDSDALAEIVNDMNAFSASLSISMTSLDPSLSASGVKQTLILLDVAAAIVRGMIGDGVIFGNFERIDGWELQAWLKHHGCNYSDSTVIRSGYDACFAYTGGDTHVPSISAAVGLHGALRLWFTYKGSIFWPMESGMGEVIFTPLYRVLRRRGVKFNFFHRVTGLHLAADRKNVDSIDIDVQAVPKASDGIYEPFVTVKNMECWPSEPLYDQLVDGDSLRGSDLESAWTAPPPVATKRLRRGSDFDAVVLGISLGGLKTICQELIAASGKWKTMVDHVPTVQTQAAQLWLKATPTQLGFSAGTAFPNSNAACVSSFVEPFDTYVDMTSLKIREDWQPSDRVAHLAYFCNVLPDAAHIPAPGTDPQFPARQLKAVKDNTISFLGREISALWPRANVGADGFNWEFLVAPDNVHGPRRFEHQYFRANIDPSSRYVLSPPGTISDRLHPDASGFDNLYLAGDWTYTPMNSGCFEAGTMSGLKAAQAITGRKKKIYGWP